MATRLNRLAAHLQSAPSALHAAATASSGARSVQLVFSPEVRKALNEKRAVVALESTIISHGMPYPQNLETAVQVEEVVRQNGGTPATIAILGGVIHIGLTHNQLEQLAKLGHKCKKVSRRDLAIVLAEKSHGATTVAATMYLAHLAGIKVFVTGGIGGVHRGVESTMDVSADLTELGRTPVAVVSAGVKSILDIPKTLEYLETQGVTVMTVGAKEFPAFFTPHSGCESPHSVSNAQEAAKIVASNALLGLESGMVIAVPVPESEAANAEPVQRAINEALAEANSKHILGRDVTPFLLKRVNELTKGDSLRSNIALVKNNAKVGTQIAVAANAILHSSSPSAAPLKVA